MEFVRNEVFGPLMSVLSFKTEDEAVARANATQFGLAGAVFTRDFTRAHRVATRIQAGIVWINDYNVTPPEVPFGGYKQSGVGRENGLQAIEHYTQVKTIYANLGDVAETY
jgi:betaine-aldehyde dehydrogenase